MIQPAQAPAQQDITLLPEEYNPMALIEANRRSNSDVSTSHEERSPFIPAIRN